MYHILVVDDAPPIREWLKLCILRNFSGKVQVDCAADGPQALCLFAGQRHDIVIADIVMPAMDGLELLAKLKQIRQDFCSVVLSSHSKFEYVRTAMKLNSSEYILKQEMDELHLVEVLNRCFARLNARSRHTANLLNRDGFLALLTSHERPNVPINAQALADAGISLSNAPVLSFVIFRKYHRPTRFVMPSTAGEDFSLYNINSYARADNYSVLFCNVDAGGRTVRDILSQVQLVNPACTILEGALLAGPEELGRCLKAAQDIAPLGFYLPSQLIEQALYRQILAQRPAAGKRLQVLAHQFRKAGLAKTPAMLADYFSLSAQCCPKDIYAYKQQCLQIFRRIALLAGAPASAAETGEQAIAEAFSMEEIRAVMEQASTAAPLLEPKQACSPHIVQALAYLHQNYPTITGLNEVAAHIHVSPEYFSRLFKAETGCTFISYLNHYRLAQAKRLLDETSLKIFQVAEQVGYASLSYFSKLFKEAYGVNPFDYRSQTSQAPEAGGDVP